MVSAEKNNRSVSSFSVCQALNHSLQFPYISSLYKYASNPVQDNPAVALTAVRAGTRSVLFFTQKRRIPSLPTQQCVEGWIGANLQTLKPTESSEVSPATENRAQTQQKQE